MWFTTTAWMMWNALVSPLVLGAGIVMLDGSPLHPDLENPVAARRGAPDDPHGGRSGLPDGVPKGRRRPAELRLSRLRQLAAAGSPLPAEGYDWVYEQLGGDILLNVGSGGTDVCTGIVQGGPLQPVYRGEIAGCPLSVDGLPTTPTASRSSGSSASS